MITGNEPITALQDGGYPSNKSVIENDTCIGLTIRQHFAAMAMQGFVQHDKAETFTSIAEGAVKMADALINELNKKP